MLSKEHSPVTVEATVRVLKGGYEGGTAVNPTIKRKDGRQLYPAKSLHRRIRATGSKIGRGGGCD